MKVKHEILYFVCFTRVGWLPYCHVEEKEIYPGCTLPTVILAVVGKTHKFKTCWKIEKSQKYINNIIVHNHKKHQESFYARKNDNVLKNKESYMYIP
jgi:hypothetical protein